MQRPVMVLEGCELVGHARVRTFHGLMAWCGVLRGPGAKSFIGTKFDSKEEKFILGQEKENLLLV